MNRRLCPFTIVSKLAEQVCRRVTRKVIVQLQRMEDALLSGDHSGLKNTWDEICVQVQHEESVDWDTYEETLHVMVAYEVEELPEYECEAVWLQTDPGDEWDSENDDEREAWPVVEDDVTNYLLDRYVYAEADRWTNARIRAFLDRT